MIQKGDKRRCGNVGGVLGLIPAKVQDGNLNMESPLSTIPTNSTAQRGRGSHDEGPSENFRRAEDYPPSSRDPQTCHTRQVPMYFFPFTVVLHVNII